jgi:iron complex outermembrane recepter protein
VNSVKVCNSASNTKGGAVGGTLLFDRGYLGLSTSEYKSTYGTVAEEYVTIGMVRRHHAIEGKLRDVGDWFQDVKFQGGYTNTHILNMTPMLQVQFSTIQEWIVV